MFGQGLAPRLLLAAALIAKVILPPLSAWAGTATLTPSQDNTLYEDANGALSNGGGSYLFAGRTDDDALRRGLVAFDIAGSVPAGARITGVTLTLTLSATIAGDESVELHRLLASWGEGTSDASGQEGMGAAATTNDATWIHRFFNAVQWNTAGGDFAGAASAAQTVGGAGSYVWGSTPQMVSDVQAWLDDPAGNFGWLLLGNESDSPTTKRFNSRENINAATVPTLVVTFLDPVQAPTLSITGLLLASVGLLLLARWRMRADRSGI